MTIHHDDVERLLRLLESSAFDELHLELDGLKLDIRRLGAAAAPAGLAAAAITSVGVKAVASTAGAELLAPATGAAAQPRAGDAVAPPAGDESETRAPMLGTFYRSPKPGAAPFVKGGDRVEAETVIGIVEVMKLMNSVQAGVSGEVVAVLAADGDLVEYDQPLLRLRVG